MAIRVRKLARELERSPAEVVGLLHALGHDRYRSADDQIPDPLVPKLRQAIKQGVKPVSVAIDRGTETSAARPSALRRAGDLMAQLVPGVVRHGEMPAPRAAPPAPVSAIHAPTPSAPRSLVPVVDIAAPVASDERRAREAERAALAAEREALATERVALERERASLERELAGLDLVRVDLASERAEIAAERASLASDRARLAAERAQAATQRYASQGTPLVELLESRGLRGPDEQERALGSLAASRQLRTFLASLRTTDPEGLGRILAERIVLAAGPSTMPGAAVVVVGAERAELPEREDVERDLKAISEQLMLLGLRRVAVVGGPARWHKLLRDGLDARIELRFQPGGLRTRAAAESDVTRIDLVVLWATPIAPDAQEVYGTSRAVVVEVPTQEVSTFLRTLRRRLSEV